MKKQKEPFKALVDGMKLSANGMLRVSHNDMIFGILMERVM